MLSYIANNNNKSEWIVFIHGLGGSGKTWKKQLPFFGEEFNTLTIDLPGHGDSQNVDVLSDRCPSIIAGEIAEILDYNKIEKAHFEGMSLGTIVLLFFCSQYPSRVLSVIMAGGIISTNKRILFGLSSMNKVHTIISQTNLYKIFSKIIMPKKNHQTSRLIFIREAAKVGKEEFLYWANFLLEVSNPETIINIINNQLKVKILYIMGSEDYIFLKTTKKYVGKIKNASLAIINNCGHVCNIEKSQEYNILSRNFLANI